MPPTAAQRREVYARASGCCEYCRIADDQRTATFEIDHVIPVRRGGGDSTQNLCLACAPCNRYKGAAVASIDPLTDTAAKLFHPRRQEWESHFIINPNGLLIGLTPEGRATVAELFLNEAPRVGQRYGEMLLGNYPCQPTP